MPQLTVPQIIELGDTSTYLSANYQDEGKIFGARKAVNSPQTIALVTDAVRWQWDSFPDVQEVRATAEITIFTPGDPGDVIIVYVNDPLLGIITLGRYEITDADTTTSISAAHIAASLATNTYNYDVSATNNIITVTAAEGVGASINGGVRLFFTILTPTFLSTQTNRRFTTQNNSYIITQ